jgi:hypothetical protein
MFLPLLPEAKFRTQTATDKIKSCVYSLYFRKACSPRVLYCSDYHLVHRLGAKTTAFWLASFHLIILSFSSRTMTYVSSFHYNLTSLYLKFRYSNSFPCSINIHVSDQIAQSRKPISDLNTIPLVTLYLVLFLEIGPLHMKSLFTHFQSLPTFSTSRLISITICCPE